MQAWKQLCVTSSKEMMLYSLASTEFGEKGQQTWPTGKVKLLLLHGISVLSHSPFFVFLSEGADVRTLTKTAGENFKMGEIEAALVQHKPAIFFLAQGESSTGVVQPIEGVGALCSK